MNGEDSRDTGGLSPQYHTYERQKCFIAYTEQAQWSDDLLSACREVLSRPEFNLEPDYARKHFYPDIPLRQKALELIANARYGIYDLSYWRDARCEWQVPCNVFIELGMAIVLNRPALLLRHANNRGLGLPECLESVRGHILEFSGETTLKQALEEGLPQWVDAPPERDWWNRYCIFGGRVCEYRAAHPRARQWGQKALHCHISDGPDVDRDDFRGVVEEVLGRFSDMTFDYLDVLSVAKGYDFLLCTYCQAVRSTAFAIYRLTSHSPAETFVAVGMSIALEAQFDYRISKILLTENVWSVPSLLSGYEVVVARSDGERKKRLQAFVPTVVHRARETVWKPRLLPFIQVPIELTPPSEELGILALDWVTNPPDELSVLLEQILGDAIRLTNVEASGTVQLVDEVTGELILRAQKGMEGRRLIPELQRIKIGEGVTGLAARQKRTIRLGDVSSVGYYLEYFEGMRSEMATPLIAKEGVIGVLNLESPQPNAFDPEDESRFIELATAAAQAISGTIDRNREGERRHWLDRIRDAMSTQQDLSAILSVIVRAAVETVRADSAVIYPYDSRREDYYDMDNIVAYGLSSDLRIADRRRRVTGMAAYVRRAGQVVISNIEEDDPAMLASPFIQREGVRSFVGISLESDAYSLGIMYINHRVPREYTDYELEWIRGLASQAAAAIKQTHAEAEQLTDGIEFRDSLYYDRLHSWARVEGNVVTQGITDFGQRVFQGIVFVELPGIGRDVDQGQYLLAMETDVWVGRVAAMVSGKLVETNEELEWEPSLINESPFDEGWLVKIEMSDPEELENLMRADSPEFKVFIGEETKKHRELLAGPQGGDV